LPCQRLYAAPQFWQTKERVDLAMGEVSRRLGGLGRLCSTTESEIEHKKNIVV